MATPDLTTEASSAGGNDTASAPSGPPPVATRHDHQGVIVTSIERPAPELVESCRALYTGLVLDHLGKHGGMTPDLKPVWSGASLCGPAITCLGTDWRIRSMAARPRRARRRDRGGGRRGDRGCLLRRHDRDRLEVEGSKAS